MTKTIKVRQYGDSGGFVILLHGGPAAPGYMKPVAEKLADRFRVVEPFQRGSNDVPLTVAQHIQDLKGVVERYCGDEKPVVIGHSWGAMLALAWAAEHLDTAKALMLIGCGTFDAASRERMQIIREQRMDAAFRQRLDELPNKYSNQNVRLGILGSMYQQLDSVNLVDVKNDLHKCDAKAHDETWGDMLRLMSDGVYPQAFSEIKIPVLMLHGEDDPHPGSMIRDALKSFLPQLEYHTWSNCGHYPWLETAAIKDFFRKLTDWLTPSA